ncbi:hypothetical protein [Agromyces sp. Marseille-Q5079]|uniref:hypothetical protein n=1 Tax=Agromyces sp. Marseille-Q5079 TaxID=3439059 RepID=UPI003D9CAB7F
MPIPRARRLTLAATAAALAFTLSGCSADADPTSSPRPTASDDAAPIFASDEEAISAFQASYGEFLEASVDVTNGGGADVDGLSEVASGQALLDEQQAAEELTAEGLRTKGSASFSIHSVQEVDATADSISITAYVCDDIHALDLIDDSGTSVVADDRVSDVPYTVVVAGAHPAELKVNEKVLWERENFCLA